MKNEERLNPKNHNQIIRIIIIIEKKEKMTIKIKNMIKKLPIRRIKEDTPTFSLKMKLASISKNIF